MSSGYGLKIRAGRRPAHWAQWATEIPGTQSQVKPLNAPRSNIYSEVKIPELPLCCFKSKKWQQKKLSHLSRKKEEKRKREMENDDNYSSIVADWQLPAF